MNSSAWKHGADVMDEWQPAGGMLLDDDDDNDGEDDDHVALADDDHNESGYDADGRVWSGLSVASRDVEDILRKGMIFGEGLEFQGEVIVPAIGREGTDDAGLPLRRGGSEVGKKTRSSTDTETRHVAPTKKVYEVVRKLGAGSYAVVYLVRETGGRKREYGESSCRRTC